MGKYVYLLVGSEDGNIGVFSSFEKAYVEAVAYAKGEDSELIVYASVLLGEGQGSVYILCDEDGIKELKKLMRRVESITFESFSSEKLIEENYNFMNLGSLYGTASVDKWTVE